uniref:Uncharacterized protein n=1 Tax=Manihot esculenta TaxID=3983 RepID=A0A2C9WIG3_MANES
MMACKHGPFSHNSRHSRSPPFSPVNQAPGPHHCKLQHVGAPNASTHMAQRSFPRGPHMDSTQRAKLSTTKAHSTPNSIHTHDLFTRKWAPRFINPPCTRVPRRFNSHHSHHWTAQSAWTHLGHTPASPSSRTFLRMSQRTSIPASRGHSRTRSTPRPAIFLIRGTASQPYLKSFQWPNTQTISIRQFPPSFGDINVPNGGEKEKAMNRGEGRKRQLTVITSGNGVNWFSVKF